MEQTIRTRLGDGSLVEMTPSEIRADLEDGTQAAAKRSKQPPLGEDELAHLHDIFCSNARFSAVDIGDEVVLSFDGSGNADVGSRVEEMTVYQNHHGADMTELWNIDYSYKAIKTILSYESNLMKSCQLNLVAPCQYGAMPDLGRYSQPDGPVPNWSELMPLGKIAEARAAQEEAAEHATRDMLFVADAMAEAGADGMDFDTAGGGRRRRLPRHAARGRGDPSPLPRHEHRGRHGERVRARHARRARVPGSRASPACGRTTRPRSSPRPGRPSSARPST